MGQTVWSPGLQFRDQTQGYKQWRMGSVRPFLFIENWLGILTSYSGFRLSCIQGSKPGGIHTLIISYLEDGGLGLILKQQTDAEEREFYFPTNSVMVLRRISLAQLSFHTYYNHLSVNCRYRGDWPESPVIHETRRWISLVQTTGLGEICRVSLAPLENMTNPDEAGWWPYHRLPRHQGD